MLKRDIMYKYIMFFFLLTACNLSGEGSGEADKEKYRDNEIMDKSNLETATFGAGCFWCVEAVFQRVKGVEKVVSGYSGGSLKNPTYDQVCTGRTGHAEVIQIEFDPAIVSFTELLEIFWSSHDPTTLNRQGADIGTQYRSAVFYHSQAQKESAEFYKNKLDASGVYSSPVVTEITEFDLFYAAEKYHHDYYDNNSSQPYCSFVITPKLEKFKKVFKEKLK